MGKAKKKTGSQNSVRLINYFGIGNVGCILLFRLIDSLQIT